MAKQLTFLNEAELRFRISHYHAELYFARNPAVTVGSQYLGRVSDVADHDTAWEVIDRYLGHVMPADLVDEDVLDRFDGISYIGGGFSYIACPCCHQPLRGVQPEIDVRSTSQVRSCPHCGSAFGIVMSDQLPEASSAE